MPCFVLFGPEPPPGSAETQPDLLQQLIMTEPCPAAATSPALQEPSVIQLEDSVPAGSMSSGVSAQNVPQDTMGFPTADVSEYINFWLI